MQFDVIVSGIGGQGVIFLTRLVAGAAAAGGLPVMVAESHGMSQRGGSVLSHLRIGSAQAPLIQRGSAHLLLALDRQEGIRALPYLGRSGSAVINGAAGLSETLARRLTALQIEVNFVDASAMGAELGALTMANTILAGYTAALPAFPLRLEFLHEAVSTMAPQARERNRRALAAGYEAAGRQQGASLNGSRHATV